MKNITSKQLDIELKWNEIHRFYRLKEKLEMKYHFEIPNYIVDEIINGNDYKNLCSLIRLAAANNKISEKNANILIKSVKKINI